MSVLHVRVLSHFQNPQTYIHTHIVTGIIDNAFIDYDCGDSVFQHNVLKIEAAGSSETLVTTYHIT
jgi:hypothetical protein